MEQEPNQVIHAADRFERRGRYNAFRGVLLGVLLGACIWLLIATLLI